MPYRILIADPAFEDLERAIAYIAVALGSPKAASDLADEFERKLEQLRDNPLIYGIEYGVSDIVGEAIRNCPVKRYEIWFTIDEEAKTVGIVAFTHGKQDATRILWRRL